MTTRTGTGVVRSSPSVLVVAGEASGDRIAAHIARSLQRDGVRCIGMGGAASRAAGVELIADFRRSSAMGLTEVMARLPAIATAFVRLAKAARKAPPSAAVLVDYTEFNLRLGAFLKRLGVPVLWCVAPQVWAWRPGRMAQVARALDRLAVILPFEASMWRAQGVDAHYVGHPALDVPPVDRAAARARLGLAPARPSIAILPGSRVHEARRHAPLMLAARKELERTVGPMQARLLLAASLDAATRRWLASIATENGVPVIEVDPDEGAAASLGAFDVSLTASGTATLECALAGAPPVVVYQLSPLSAAIASRLVRTPFVALPNIVLGSGVYPELLEPGVDPRRVASAVAAVLERRATFEPWAKELRARLAWQAGPSSSPFGRTAGTTAAERAAGLLSDWLHFGSAHPPLEPQTTSRADPTAPAPSPPP